MSNDDKSVANVLWWSSGVFGLHRFYMKSWVGLLYMPILMTALLLEFSPNTMLKVLGFPLFMIVGAMLIRDFLMIQQAKLEEKQCKQSKYMYFILGLAAECLMALVLLFTISTVIMAFSM